MTRILDLLDLGGNRASNAGAAINPGDLVTLAQVQQFLAGLDPKQSVRVKTITQTTLSGLSTLNGYALQSGDRVLVVAQTTASENGIYVASAGAWARATDAVQGTLTAGALVAVESGTADADTMWLLTTDDPFTVGTTGQTWSKFGTGGAYTGGNGVSIIGNVISLIVGAGLVLDATSLRLDPASTVFARHRSYAVPAGTSPVVTHDLGTTSINAQLWDISGASPELVIATVRATSTTTATLPNITAAANQYRLDLVG